MRIALDAMGSDNHSAPDVAGGVQAAAEYGATIVLVGDEVQIKTELKKHDTSGLSIEVVHASQKITMEDKPGEIIRTKTDSSMHVGLGLVDKGDCAAFVSCGNTGAILGIATVRKSAAHSRHTSSGPQYGYPVSWWFSGDDRYGS